jgi:hypothetical protein
MTAKHTGDPNHRYFMYSPEGDGFTFYTTEEECKAAAEKEIHTYKDDGYWFEEVEGIFIGIVTHEVHEKVLETRPENYYDMTEDERDDLWPYPDDAERIVTYELEALDKPL